MTALGDSVLTNTQSIDLNNEDSDQRRRFLACPFMLVSLTVRDAAFLNKGTIFGSPKFPAPIHNDWDLIEKRRFLNCFADSVSQGVFSSAFRHGPAFLFMFFLCPL